MWIAKDWNDYELLGCGNGLRLERWGNHRILRPDTNAKFPAWHGTDRLLYDGCYTFGKSGGHWECDNLPKRWSIQYRYGIIIFLGILCGIGGSVLMSNAKGKGSEEKGNAYFTASFLLMTILIVIFWVAFALLHEQIFTLFGADQSIMPKVMEYAQWLIWFFPVFIAPTFISSFIRNDGAPGLAMLAVIFGGCLNVFGDWFLVFPLGMGMQGAAIATVCGTSAQVLIMSSHFFKKKCGLKLVKPFQIGKAFQKILVPEKRTGTKCFSDVPADGSCIGCRFHVYG